MAQRTGRRGDAQGYIFPPLWGPDSFNDGAGMNRLLTARASSTRTCGAGFGWPTRSADPDTRSCAHRTG
jgi:thiosulfate dehydrogenase